MGERLDLHQVLVSILGSSYVYFQPPSDLQMAYPCIVYERDSAESSFADNGVYRNTKRYTATVIDEDPDSEVVDKMILLPMCVLSRSFKNDNLNHDAFTLFF